MSADGTMEHGKSITIGSVVFTVARGTLASPLFWIDEEGSGFRYTQLLSVTLVALHAGRGISLTLGPLLLIVSWPTKKEEATT